jgi:2-dehydro-3-deoxy-L-rhamnonate dehydrogenase (NAD+)
MNVVAPATVDTDLIGQFSANAINAMIARTPLTRTPLNRLGTVEEVARLVTWFSSDHFRSVPVQSLTCLKGRATY